MTDVLLDSLKDTALLIPFLFLVHLLIGLFESGKLNGIKRSGALRGGLAPLIGTGVALLPQCGFSVVASELYSKKYIRVGTLVAVFIATSDEALPILFGSAVTNPSVWAKLGMLIGAKVVLALVAGYALNFVFRRRQLNVYDETEMPHDHGCCGHTPGGLEDHDEDAHEQERHGVAEVFDKYFKHPIIHTLTITLFVFFVNFTLGTVIFLAGGEEIFAEFMSRGTFFQPIFAVLVGLIPNCAASVMITEMFAGGSLTLGAAVAGLTVNAGFGIAVLIKDNKNIKENAVVIGALVAIALAAGYAITGITALVA